MKRFVIIYLALLAVGMLLWPALKGTGLMQMPGDVVLTIEGDQVGAPFATACVLALTVFGVWRILEP